MFEENERILKGKLRDYNMYKKILKECSVDPEDWILKTKIIKKIFKMHKLKKIDKVNQEEKIITITKKLLEEQTWKIKTKREKLGVSESVRHEERRNI